MPDWKNSLIPADASIRDAIKTINDGGYEIALVADGEGSLLGTVTGGEFVVSGGECREWLSQPGLFCS